MRVVRRWISVAAILSLAGSGFAAADDYALSRGGDLPVCKSFLFMLEGMNSEEKPLCNRKEPSAAPGIEPLNRRFLSADEIYAIAEPLIGFADHRDVRYYDLYRARTEEWCATKGVPETCMKLRLQKRAAAADGSRWLETYSRRFFDATSAWTYQPEVDIDNDGVADPVLLLTLDRCGSENYKGVLETSATDAFVMDPGYSTVDVEKTQRIFGHPDPEWPSGYDNGQFRYIGQSFGVFVYRGKTYFYTPLTSFADFEGKRVLDESLSEIVGVFVNERGETRNLCELRPVRGRGDRKVR